MSHCLRRLVSPVAVMAGILIMGATAPARADLEIWISASTGTNNNPPVSTDVVASAASGTSVSYTNTSFSGFSISALATSSDSPGTPTFADITGSTVSIQNNNAGTASLYITLGDTGFTGPLAPTGSVTVTTNVGATVVTGSSANLLSFNSYVNNGPSAAQNATSGSTTAQSLNITTVGAPATSTTFSVSPLASGFSLTERYQITLGAGSQINFSSTTLLTKGPSFVPEPSRLAIAGLGALGFIGNGLRRRKAPGA
jgi:hypothetical protein